MDKIPVYFVPGMAAGIEIFRNIKLPEDRYTMHFIEWLIPEPNETMQDYAQRMAREITDENPVLVGVSFGGVMVQEMVQFIQVRKLIIISSVKSKNELPKRMKFAKLTQAYKLVPTQLAATVDDLTTFAVGPKSKKRLKLYNEYLSVRDKTYLDWAIEKMVQWNREKADPQVIHIHGDADAVFPIRYIQNAQIVAGGTHVMILNKGAVITKLLEKNIEQQ